MEGNVHVVEGRSWLLVLSNLVGVIEGCSFCYTMKYAVWLSW